MLRYRIVMALAWLAIPVAFVLRLARGKDSPTTFAARLGLARSGAGGRPVIWLHAASVGELNTLTLLIGPFLEAFPGHDLLVTVSNRIAYEKARALAGERVHVAIAPLDFPSALRRFLGRWQPVLSLTLENEVYPLRMEALARRGVPIIYVNARMSERSHAAWARRRQFARHVFGRIRLCFAQDPASGERFEDLGVPQERMRMLGNLKQFQPAVPPDHPDLATIRAAFPPERTLLVASTHRGEDETLIEAFQAARARHPGLRMILAPRHPARSGEIAQLLGRAGLAFATRSKGEMPGRKDDVYLADTVGEMALWYASAAVTFVAGSLVPVGGHTPYEPAGFGSAIIHGPMYSNFEEAYARLLAEKGSVQAENAEEIAAAWIALLDPDTRSAQVKAAQKALFEGGDKARVIGGIIGEIAPLLPSARQPGKRRPEHAHSGT